MILAVLERKAGLALAGADVFLNIAGGVRVEEPAIDLAIALAVASSLRERAVDASVVAFGEIGLAGEVRGVARAEQRLAEAAAMGFQRAIVPASTADLGAPEGLTLVPVRTVEDAIEEAIPR
jgi:DNA repair protein RadA/Sms